MEDVARAPGREDLLLLDRATGAVRSLTGNFDASVDAFEWDHDGKRLYFDAEERGTKPLWTVSLKGNDVKKLVDGGVNGDVHVAGGTMVFSRAYQTRAAEVYAATADGKKVWVTLGRANHVAVVDVATREPLPESEAGELQIRDDIYGRDQRMLAVMKGADRKVADIPVDRPKGSSTSAAWGTIITSSTPTAICA